MYIVFHESSEYYTYLAKSMAQLKYQPFQITAVDQEFPSGHI